LRVDCRAAMSVGAAQSRQIQRVYSEWCVKAAEIILASRIHDPSVVELPFQASASFNLKVPELFDVRSEAVACPEFFQLKTQRSFQVEIYLGAPAEASSSISEDEVGQLLLERWTFTFFPAHPEPSTPDRCNQTLVRKQGVTLRSLMCFTRLLPAYALCRGLRGSSARHWRFRVEAWPPTSRATPTLELSTQDFVSLQSSVGTLRLSVSQRKDLKTMRASGPFRSTAAIGSQLDPIEVEESYFTGALEATASTDAATALGRLDKIAEEPEGKASVLDRHQYDAAEQTRIAPLSTHEPASVRGDRIARPRLSSEDSISSTVSTSSKPYSLPEHTVTLGSTPPLASAAWTGPPPGLITLGPKHRGDSPSSSRSVTPQTTPKLGPAPEPATSACEQRARAVPPASAGPSLATGTAAASTAGPPLSGAMAQAGLGHGLLYEDNGAVSPAHRPGEVDDLSGIWMRCPPEWGSHRRSLSIGTCSRGSGAYSRSLSPEDARDTADAARLPGRTAEVSGAGSGSKSGGCSPHGVFPLSSQSLLPPEGSENEIRMFGMSDDEDEDPASEDEDEIERNIVASTIQDSSGAAFATACPDDDPESLGLAGLDFLEHRPSFASDGSGISPRLLSPLIAQLNPFIPSPPSLDLPPAAVAWGGLVEEQTSQGPGVAGTAETAPVPVAAGSGPEVHRLLAEMGDLVCKLQKRPALAITTREVLPGELLDRLTYFREVGASSELKCHS